MTAEDLGREAARQVRAEYGAVDPGALARRMGVIIEESDRDGGWGTVTVFADYTPRPPKITVYPAGAARRAHYLAHELFHHWEALHPEQRRKRLESEQAAEAFAHALLD